MYTYQEIYALMRKFHTLGTNEVRIMDYLMQTNVAEVGYSELTEALGLDKKKMESNIRKALLHLQDMGIVCIVNMYTPDERKGQSNPMKACYIIDGWMDTFLK